MKEEDIKIGVKITFPEDINRNDNGTYIHFITANNVLITNTLYNEKVIFEIISFLGDNVVLKTLFPVSGKNNGVFMCERYILRKYELIMTEAEVIEDSKIDKSKYEVSLTNYKIHIDKNGYRSSDKIETIEDIKLERLANNERYNTLCENNVSVHVYEKSSSYNEYDEFFFQSENAEVALSIGMYLYNNQEKNRLPEVNKYSLSLFINGQYGYNEMLNTNQIEAHIDWIDYLYEQNKATFKEQEPLRVWRFDAAGPCVYGEAIVVAKNDTEALHTFTVYAQENDIDMLKNFNLEPTEEVELSTPLKEAKVISAWYDIC